MAWSNDEYYNKFDNTEISDSLTEGQMADNASTTGSKGMDPWSAGIMVAGTLAASWLNAEAQRKMMNKKLRAEAEANKATLESQAIGQGTQNKQNAFAQLMQQYNSILR